VLVWLSVRGEVQIVCIWSSWCHCSPKPHHLLHHLNPDWFECLAGRYRSTAAGAVLQAPALSSKCGSSTLRADCGGSTQTRDIRHRVALGLYDIEALYRNCKFARKQVLAYGGTLTDSWEFKPHHHHALLDAAYWHHVASSVVCVLGTRYLVQKRMNRS